MSGASRTVVVVGAGPVGCLAAIMFARRGWQVQVYEGRKDMRLASVKAAAYQRSINMAISHRGIAALHAVHPDCVDQFLLHAIPMRGRMIHKPNGQLDSQEYDRDGQYINSIDRALLNEGLLSQLDSYSNISTFFEHKVVAADFDARTLLMRNLATNIDVAVPFDFCVGADGSYSVIRRQMMRVVRMDFQQEYIRDEYVELKMPAGKNKDGLPIFQLDPNHLHIWPRHSFMLIALPNKDKTFTCTLFAPTAELDRLNSADSILTWFKLYFPDAVRAIGEKTLVEDFMRNPRSSLICTKANPYHYKDRAIILGDAAHSMVPFYGQGLNCGLEDVRILSTLLDEEGVESTQGVMSDAGEDRRLARVLERYTEGRHEDLIAICDLAMNNYVEMRHSVTQLSYLFRKTVDNVLYSLSSPHMVSLASLLPVLTERAYPSGKPQGWLPLYTMVTFRPDISYAAVRDRATLQGRILTGLGWIGVGAVGVAGTWIARRMLLGRW